MMNIETLPVKERPSWDYKLTEEQVRHLSSDIKKITHHWKMIGVDTAQDWVLFHRVDGTSFKAPDGWQDFFVFNPDHRSLIRPNRKGGEARRRLAEIEMWEVQNTSARAQYEELKKYFEAGG